MTKVTRRFSIPGVQYDYVIVEAEGENPTEVLRDIYRSYYIELAMINLMKGRDIDLNEILDKIDESMIEIMSYIKFRDEADPDIESVEEVPWD
jgi:hypothetical protein